MQDPNPQPPPSQQQKWWEGQSGRPPLTPEQQEYYGDWIQRADDLAAQMGPKRIAPSVIWQNQPQNYPTGPVNTDPTTGGGTGEFRGAPLGSGLARRPAQPSQGQSRSGGRQFKAVQAQPRHVLRQQALQRPMGKKTTGTGKATRATSKAGSLPFR